MLALMEEGTSIIFKLEPKTFNAQQKQILDDGLFDISYAKSILLWIMNDPETGLALVEKVHDQLHQKAYDNAKLTDLRNHI